MSIVNKHLTSIDHEVRRKLWPVLLCGMTALTSSLVACSSADFTSPTATSAAGSARNAQGAGGNKTGPGGNNGTDAGGGNGSGRGGADGASRGGANKGRGGSDSAANGGSDFPSAQTPPQALALSCAQLSDPSQAKITLEPTTPGKPPRAVLTGHICPQAQTPKSVSVLFIVDWSGSMATSDPSVGGSCGRLQAVKAITSYLINTASPSTQIQEGLIPFSSDIENTPEYNGLIPMSDVNSFATNLTSQKICAYRSNGATNYIAPLQLAKQWLANVSGRAVIYFITDGEPNVDINGSYHDTQNSSANDPTVVSQVVNASQDLMTSHPGLTFNSLLLGTGGAKAESTMDSMTGDPSRVRLVASAANLAQSILSFQAPVLMPTSATATLSTASSSQTVAVTSIGPDPQSPGNWQFTTAPFQLNDSSGLLQIAVRDSDGGTQTASAAVVVKKP